MGSKMSAPSTSGLLVELLLRVIDVKYGYFTASKLSAMFEVLLEQLRYPYEEYYSSSFLSAKDSWNGSRPQSKVNTVVFLNENDSALITSIVCPFGIEPFIKSVTVFPTFSFLAN